MNVTVDWKNKGERSGKAERKVVELALKTKI